MRGERRRAPTPRASGRREVGAGRSSRTSPLWKAACAPTLPRVWAGGGAWGDGGPRIACVARIAHRAFDKKGVKYVSVRPNLESAERRRS